MNLTYHSQIALANGYVQSVITVAIHSIAICVVLKQSGDDGSVPFFSGHVQSCPPEKRNKNRFQIDGTVAFHLLLRVSIVHPSAGQYETSHHRFVAVFGGQMKGRGQHGVLNPRVDVHVNGQQEEDAFDVFLLDCDMEEVLSFAVELRKNTVLFSDIFYNPTFNIIEERYSTLILFLKF